MRTVYMEVIDNVISNMRQTFLDDGTDEQVLQDLKAVSVVMGRFASPDRLPPDSPNCPAFRQPLPPSLVAGLGCAISGVDVEARAGKHLGALAQPAGQTGRKRSSG